MEPRVDPQVQRDAWIRLLVHGNSFQLDRYRHAGAASPDTEGPTDGIFFHGGTIGPESPSPALGVAPPRLERADLRIPDATEMRMIVQAAAHTPFGLPILLAATTGLRRSEVLAVHWADVDTEAGTLRVQRGKTSAARRTISLPPSAVAALKRHRKEQSERRLLCGAAWQDTDLLVDRGDGGPIDPDSLSHAFAAIAERVGLPEVRLHDLRHGFASALLKAGVNVKVVSEALGHSRSSFTLDVYAHVLPGMGEQVASVIETALGGTADG